MTKKYDAYEEQINNILNINALLLLLSAKNIIKDYEFRGMKQKATEDFKKEFPYLFVDK